MILTDTHTHLYVEAFDEDRDLVIGEAIEAGIRRFFIPAIDASYLDAMHALKKSYPKEVFLMTGLHPTHVKENFEEELAVVYRELQTGNYVGVGEIGIDLYWDRSFIAAQKIAFEKQILWAREFDLPFVIHCRDAFDEVFEVLDSVGGSFRGIFHCFTGNLEQAKKAVSHGLKLGIGGVVTFKNGKIDQFINELPLESIVLETDAPYLSPTPHRGKRNNPSYLLLIAKKLAECYGLSIEEIAKITTENSKSVFKV